MIFAGKKVLVFGTGKSGIAAEDLPFVKDRFFKGRKVLLSFFTMEMTNSKKKKS